MLIGFQTQAQQADGTWEAEVIIDNEIHKLELSLYFIDSSRNKKWWYYGDLLGSISIDKGDGTKKQVYPIKGQLDKDQSMRLVQVLQKEESNCYWSFSLGLFQKRKVLQGYMEKKGRKRNKDSCPDLGTRVQFKKVINRA